MGKDINVSFGLNKTLAQFLQATEGRSDDMRLSNRDGIRTDWGDVGKLSRLFKSPSGAEQIQENNDIRTQLLNALSEQFGGRHKIPVAVKKALYGSGVFGKSDMSADADLRVNSGRPLTVRRVRAIISTVVSELTKSALQQNGETKTQKVKQQPKVEPLKTEPPKQVKDASYDDEVPDEEFKIEYNDDLNANEENEDSVVSLENEVKIEKNENLHPLDNTTIEALKKGMTDSEIKGVEVLVAADQTQRAHDAKWFDAYTKQIVSGLTIETNENKKFWNDVYSKGNATAETKQAIIFKQSLTSGCNYMLNQLRRGLDEYIRHGVGHTGVQEGAKTIIGSLFNEYSINLQIQDNKNRTKTEPLPINSEKTVGISKLSIGVALVQGQNTCPIISLMNAMLMTSEKMMANAEALMTRKIDTKNHKTYFEFPLNDSNGNKIRAYSDEFATMFNGNKALLSDFEKAVFVGLKKAGLEAKVNDKPTQPGEFFEVSPIFELFGFKEIEEYVGNRQGEVPSKFQKFMDGNAVANAIKQGKPCVLGMPGHFVGIQEVTFDEEGQPTYWYFESTSGKMQSLTPDKNNGVQFYIGENL